MDLTCSVWSGWSRGPAHTRVCSVLAACERPIKIAVRVSSSASSGFGFLFGSACSTAVRKRDKKIHVRSSGKYNCSLQRMGSR